MVEPKFLVEHASEARRARAVSRVGRLCYLVMSLALAFGARAGQDSNDAITVLTNANIIDATGAPMQTGMTLTLTGAKITGITKGTYQTNGYEGRIVDLEGRFVLPGFWNMHTHLSALLPHNHALDDATHADKVIRAGVNAMEGLRHGFTALRSVGEEDYIDVTWQKAFDEGFMVGPRIFASGAPVSPTAGHRGSTANGADGADAMRRAVRTRVQRGATSIKIHNVEMLPDEILAVVETANSLGVPVTSHSREPFIASAINVGVRGIEHGYGLTDKSIKLMAKRGTFYTPTIICNLSDTYIKEREARLVLLGHAQDPQVVRLRTAIAYADERSQQAAAFQREALRKSANAGVKLMIGSDSMPIGEIGWLEMEQFVLSGVSPMQTLIAATRTPAEYMGLADSLGTVEVGKLADLVVLDASPLDDMSNIRTVHMVFKGGVSVDLEPSAGALSFFDYFDSPGPPRPFKGRAEAQAGFSRGNQ